MLDVDVFNGTSPTIVNNHVCGSWCNHTSYYPGTTWYYPSTTVYMYQIFCPNKGCKTANWLKLDTPTPCTKCGSTLKAVTNRVDYEVEVTP